MNQRIRQLVRQAGLDDADFPIENWDNVPLEKLAELILDDVITIINNPRNYNECVYTTFDLAQGKAVAHQLATKIKEHFKDTQ